MSNKTFRLTGSARRLLRLAHLVAASGWLGVDLVFAVLAVAGFTSDDPGTVAATYLALDVFAVPLFLLLGMSALVSGLALSIASGWGIIRYWWVAAKLAINVVLSLLVLVLLRPSLTLAAVEASRVDATLPARLDDVSLDLLFPGFVSGAALLAASLMGTLKPWGRIRHRQRLGSATDGQHR